MGVTIGLIDNVYLFAATVTPITTATPVTYIWHSTGQGVSTTTKESLSDVADFTLDTAGSNTINVYVKNEDGTVPADPHTINIVAPIESVTISGAEAGGPNTPYIFTATVSPPDATLPITYHWQVTEQEDRITSTNALSHTVVFTWDTAGPKSISVTVENPVSFVTDTHTILISNSNGVIISPTRIYLSEDGLSDTYQVYLTISPTSVVTIDIATDGQVIASPAVLTFDDTNCFTPQLVTVNAIDDSELEGLHTSYINHSITNNDRRFDDIPLPQVIAKISDNDQSRVTIEGSTKGITNTLYTFTANVYSLTLPITYHWQATGQNDDITEANTNALSHSVPYSWQAPGTKVISVTVSNVITSIPAYHRTSIVEDISVYLPVILKDYVYAPDLIVEDLHGRGNIVTVTIRNIGSASILATNGFWVDVYINPEVCPTTVNQAWQQIAGEEGEGMTWRVETTLSPEDTFTLVNGDDNYREDLSKFTGLEPDTEIFAQVDSYYDGDDYSAYGKILEIHEITGDAYNNIYGDCPSEMGYFSSSSPVIIR